MLWKVSLLNLHYNLFWKTYVRRVVDGLIILAVAAPRAALGVPQSVPKNILA